MNETRGQVLERVLDIPRLLLCCTDQEWSWHRNDGLSVQITPWRGLTDESWTATLEHNGAAYVGRGATPGEAFTKLSAVLQDAKHG